MSIGRFEKITVGGTTRSDSPVIFRRYVEMFEAVPVFSASPAVVGTPITSFTRISVCEAPYTLDGFESLADNGVYTVYVPLYDEFSEIVNVVA
jgi:hypothetical protein